MLNVIAPVVSADSVRQLGDDAILVDVRWYLDGRDGRAAYEAGHVPGAIWLDLERDLSRHDLPASEGRHPLPTPAAFAAAMSAHGIGDNSVVVAYDDTGGVTAGRLVVMLRMLGRSAALLDGGLGAWQTVACSTATSCARTSTTLVPTGAKTRSRTAGQESVPVSTSWPWSMQGYRQLVCSWVAGRVGPPIRRDRWKSATHHPPRTSCDR